MTEFGHSISESIPTGRHTEVYRTVDHRSPPTACPDISDDEDELTTSQKGVGSFLPGHSLIKQTPRVAAGHPALAQVVGTAKAVHSAAESLKGPLTVKDAIKGIEKTLGAVDGPRPYVHRTAHPHFSFSRLLEQWYVFASRLFAFECAPVLTFSFELRVRCRLVHMLFPMSIPYLKFCYGPQALYNQSFILRSSPPIFYVTLHLYW